MSEFKEMRLRHEFVDADYDKTVEEFLQKLGEQSMDYLNGAQDAINLAFCMLSKAMIWGSNDMLADSANTMYTILSSTFMWQTSQLNNMYKNMESGSRREV